MVLRAPPFVVSPPRTTTSLGWRAQIDYRASTRPSSGMNDTSAIRDPSASAVDMTDCDNEAKNASHTLVLDLETKNTSQVLRVTLKGSESSIVALSSIMFPFGLDEAAGDHLIIFKL
jgi:hypothetical protein